MFFFLPLGTTRPRWRVPYLTYGLIGANVLVFILRMGSEEAMPRGFVPAHPSLPMWVASTFMHAGVFHLLGNMLFLWLFATLTEDVFGAWLLLAFYFASDLGATVLHSLVGVLFSPGSLEVPVVGASGAIAGIMGLSAVCFLRTKVRVWYLVGWFLYWRTGVAEIGAPAFVGLWVGWEVIQGLLKTSLEASYGGGGGVAHWAHVGGFAVGLGGALALKLRKRVVHTDLVEGRRPVTGQFEAFAQAGELERMVEQSPNDADAWYALGRAREGSGRLAKAGEAHARAMELFLRQRRGAEAVAAYKAMREYREMPALPEALVFLLACALEDAGRKEDAFGMFRQLTLSGQKGPQTETALIRAAEIAGGLPGYRVQAEECYQALLREFPYSPWRAMATEGLAKVRAMPRERPAPEAAPEAGPDARAKPVTRWDRLERRRGRQGTDTPERDLRPLGDVGQEEK
ncbi:MAG: rhomboid family intramembrane serine protease [Armatimonadota bacterium]|nr:MAG: rhomboid family intramembrane serine protease [Armatimonadota bacterium]